MLSDFFGYSLLYAFVISCLFDVYNRKSSYNIQVWNTDSGNLLAECNPSDGDSDICYSCIACSFIGKKVAWTSSKVSLIFNTFYARILLFCSLLV